MTANDQLIFDRGLVRLRRNRCARQNKSGNFLLDLAAGEIADRLSLVNREFETCICNNAEQDALRAAVAATGKAKWIGVSDLADRQLALRNGARVLLDEEALGLKRQALALYVSALTLHLVNDLPGALVQIRRALRPDGLFIAALLGGDTLCELRGAFLAAETELLGGASPRVAPFADVRELGALMQRAGFALPVVDTDRLTVRYDTALDLMRDLKAMSSTNVLHARSRVPASRRLLLRCSELYHQSHAEADGRLPATFQIIYLTGWAPHDSQQKPLAPGSAKQRLADALGTRERKL